MSEYLIWGLIFILFLLVLSLSHVWPIATPWTAPRQASLSFTISWRFLKLMYTESVMSSNHLLIYRLLLLPSFFPSIRIFSKELAFCIKWPKYWNFSFSISPSSEYSGLISFRIDWILQSQGLSRIFCNTTVQKHKFFSAQHSLWSISHIHT